MSRFLRATLVLFVGIAAATFAAQKLGGIRPSPLVLLFTNPDGTRCEMPCLFGIRPGSTSRTEAVALFTAHPFTRNVQAQYTPSEDMGDNTMTFSAPSMMFVVKFDRTADEHVTDVILHLSDGKVVPATAGEVVAFLNAPQKLDIDALVVLWFDPTITAVIEPNNLASAAPRLQLGDKVISLWVHEPVPTIRGHYWCGFTARSCTTLTYGVSKAG